MSSKPVQTMTPELQTLLSQLSQYLQAEAKPDNLNLLELWQQYKIAKAKLVATTTQKGDWSEVDRALNLVAAGKVSEYLPPYNLRHSWITRMIRAGLDIATVARLAGNKPDTIMKHYLAAKTQDLVLPDL